MHRCKRLLVGVALVAAVVGTSPPDSLATSMRPQNVVDLIELSERIFVGDVVALEDGFDGRGLPYTEVTVRVDDSIRGANGSTFTFRQFGLLEPRQMADGRTNLMVSPDGWPRFRDDERVMVFLYQPASQTGLQTTVGLMQGKFSIRNGVISNEISNANVFRGVEFDPSVLSADEQRLVRDSAAMPADTFVSMVRRAVEERWVESGRMIHAQQ